VLSLFLAPATPKAGVELELKGEVAALLANPLGLVVGVKEGNTEDTGALLLPVRDDACDDGGAAVLIEASIMPPVELVTRPAGFETDMVVVISI
jgi:hypothetical protein